VLADDAMCNLGSISLCLKHVISSILHSLAYPKQMNLEFNVNDFSSW
jgi:hypothetical protein